MRQLFTSILLVLFITGCSVSPQPIEYGKDACSYCDMTIVDKTHAAEYVTNKGKAYKFDAIECMIYDLKHKNENELAFVLVTDFVNPATLINANEATYLISEELKSPMGANLSAFNHNEKIDYKGEIYNWNNIKDRIKK